jgi:hypothetical protein
LPDQGAKPGHRGGKPANNRFSYGAAAIIHVLPYVNINMIESVEDNCTRVLNNSGNGPKW